MSTRVAIERVYQAFSGYQVTSVTGCPCCAPPDVLAALVAAPLRTLAQPVLERYHQSAMSTVGTLHDFKHFLPRLLELQLVSYESDGLLVHARWEDWPADEREAVEGCLIEQVLARLDEDSMISLEHFSHLLKQFALVQPRLEALLDRSPLAPRWYAQLVCDLGQHFNALTNHHAVLTDWVLSTRRTEALERAFFAEADASAAALYSNAALVLDWF